MHILTSVFGTWPLNSNPSRQPVHALKMKDFIFLKHLRNLERSPQAGGIFHHKPYYGMAQEMKANLTKEKKIRLAFACFPFISEILLPRMSGISFIKHVTPDLS